MKTEKQLIKNFTSLIKAEEKKENKDFTKILRFKRIIEIRKQQFFCQEYRTNEDEKRYIIVDNAGFDFFGEHYSLEEAKKELSFLNK